MTQEYLQVVRAWLAKAESDLASAKLLIGNDDPHLDTGSYHCQQAAEKALKGWLTANKVEFRKTHDISELLGQCIQIEVSFRAFEDAGRFLLPFATQFRYPGDVFEPSRDEALEAFESAASIVDAVRFDLNAKFPGQLE